MQRLSELGWIEGRTVVIEYRWAEGSRERASEIAAEFARLQVDLIVTSGIPSARAAKQATSSIPIVFAVVSDPVGAGLIASLARPEGNLTGLSLQYTDLAGKRLELFREALPSLRRLGTGDLGYSRQPRANDRDSRGSGDHANARPGGHVAGRPALAGPRARAGKSQGSRGGSLCSDRSADEHQPDRDQRAGAGCTPTHDARCPGIGGGGRPHVLWAEFA